MQNHALFIKINNTNSAEEHKTLSSVWEEFHKGIFHHHEADQGQSLVLLIRDQAGPQL